MEVELGVFYTLDEFRQNPMPSEQKSLFFRLNNKTVNCDIGEVEATKFRPVKIKVQDSDNSEGVWARSDDKLIIFCASDLKQWVTSYTGAGDVYYDGIPEDQFDAANVAYRETNTFRSKNPFDNREILGIQYLTQSEIDDEVEKYSVGEDELALLTVRLQKQTDDRLTLQNDITERKRKGDSTRAQEARLRMLNMQIDGTNRAMQSVRNSRALNDTLLSYDHTIINNVLSPPLNVAIESEDLKAVELLVSEEDPNLTDGYGRNALHWVAEKGCTSDILNSIMETIKDVNASDNDGMTALMYVATYQDSDPLIMNSLLETPNIDINRQNNYKNTALHCAIEENNEQVVSSLLKDGRINMGILGADDELAVEFLSEFDTTPKIVELVSNKHNEASEEAIVNYTNSVRRPLANEALRVQDYNAAAILLYGYGPNYTDPYLMNALHMVAIYGAPDGIVKIILRNIDDVNAFSSRQYTALMYAANRDRRNVVIELLKCETIDTTLTDPDGKTAYQIALEKGNTAVMKIFKDHISPLEIARVRYQGNVPLVQALLEEDEDAAEALLDDGEDPNEVDQERWNALHTAAEVGCRLPLFNRILGMIHNVNASSWAGMTALMYAVARNHMDMVVSLMNHPGINVNAQNRYNRTALHHAVRNILPTMVAQLLSDDRVDTSLKDYHGTPLDYAIKRKLVDIIKLFEDRMSPLEIARAKYQGKAPLVQALLEEDEDAAEALLDDGEDPNEVDEEGVNALQVAAWKGCRLPLFNRILSMIDDVNVDVGKQGATGLIIAAGNGHLDIVKALMNHPRINVNAADSINGYTALHWAVEKERITIVAQLLSDRRVNINPKGKKNITPLRIAIKLKLKEIIKMFEDRMTPLEVVRTKYQGNAPLVKALGAKDEDAAEALLDDGEDPNKVNKGGSNALLVAAQRGCSLPLFNRILSKIDDVNTGDNDGQTALISAAGNNHLDMVKALMNHPRINVNAVDEFENTALHMAVLNNHPTIVQQLLSDDKIDTSIKGKYVGTPFQVAIEKDFKDIIKIFERHDSVGGRVSRRHAGVLKLKF